MKVIVTVESRFEVEVSTFSTEIAEQAVQANWDTVYCHRAKWLHGCAPQLQHGRLINVHAVKMS